MRDPATIARILDSLEPRLRETQIGADAPPELLRRLLDETAGAVRAAAGELRAAGEERAAERAAVRGALPQPAPETLGLLFASCPDALLLTDDAGTIVHANPASGALLGVRREDLAGLRVESFVAEDARPAVRDVLGMVRGSIEPRRIVLDLRPRRRLPIRLEACAWSCRAGEASVAWTLRVPLPAADAPAPSGEAAALRALIDSLPVAAAAMDLDGTVLTWNPAAQRLLGWSEDEVAGRANPAVGEEMRHLLDGLRAAGPDAQPFRATTETETKDGTPLKLELWLAPLAEPGGGVTGTVAAMRAIGAAGRAAAEPESRQPWSPEELRRVLLSGAGRGEFLERLRHGLSAGVHLGHLRAGDRLPSIRDASQGSGTDHRVVSAAYQKLAADGVVEVRNRRGVVVAPLPEPDAPALGETAEWLARTLEEAAELQVRVPHLPELVRRWTATVPLHCVCIDSTEDARVALAHEMSHQWGMRATAVPAAEAGEGRAALAEALRGADLVITTAFHAHAVRALADALETPMVVATATPEMVRTVEAKLRAGPVTAVVADARYGDRLRALEHGERVRVVLASDGAAVEALDPSEPVVATLAALRRISKPLRLLVPAGHFVSPLSAREIARVLVRANLQASRAARE